MLLKMLAQQQSVVVIVVPLLFSQQQQQQSENISTSIGDKNILLKNCLVSVDKSHNFHGQNVLYQNILSPDLDISIDSCREIHERLGDNG